MTIRIGEKGRHFIVPDWADQILAGVCRKGDYFVDVHVIKPRPTEEDDWGMAAEDFACLLRPKPGRGSE